MALEQLITTAVFISQQSILSLSMISSFAIFFLVFLAIIITLSYSHSNELEVKPSHILPSIAICSAVGENALLDIEEWINYYFSIGVEKIYLYDHSKNILELPALLQKYVSFGFVDIYSVAQSWKMDIDFLYPGTPLNVRKQAWAATECMRRFRHRHNFMSFIDVDEFIVIRDKSKNSSLPLFMLDYIQKVGLSIHWKMFGSSGYLKRPVGGVLENYRYCNNNITLASNIIRSNPPGYMKSIFNTNFIDDKVKCNSHVCTTKGNTYDENMSTNFSHVTFDRIALHHYRTKSFEDFKMKSKAALSLGGEVNQQYFDDTDKFSLDYCPDLLNFSAKNIFYEPVFEFLPSNTTFSLAEYFDKIPVSDETTNCTFDLFGKEKESNKVCLDEASFRDSSCWVLSLGTSSEFLFEADVFHKTNCTLHIFECSSSKVPPPSIASRTKVHNVCLKSMSTSLHREEVVDWSALVSLATDGTNLPPSYVRIDVEGYEWAILQVLSLNTVRTQIQFYFIFVFIFVFVFDFISFSTIVIFLTLSTVTGAFKRRQAHEFQLAPHPNCIQAARSC